MEHDCKIDRLLYEDDFSQGFSQWHHEGIGHIASGPEGGMRLHCHGSRQGAEGCMAFFRPTLPDGIRVSYKLNVRSQGGLVINYVAIRGLNGEDLIEDRGRMEARTGIMANYFSRRWGLQSYHVSISRFNDKGQHTGTCNMRRNPGSLVEAHGLDMVTQLNRSFEITVQKDAGHLALYVDGQCTLGFVDRDASRYPIPDDGKFGFRLIGSDVMADVFDFKVHKVHPNAHHRKNHENFGFEDAQTP